MQTRGEIQGVLWRRSGESHYKPHAELAADLGDSPPEQVSAPGLYSRSHISAGAKEPSGDSFLGEMGSAIGACGAVVGCVIVLPAPSVGVPLIGAGLSVVAVAMLARIHAKLALVAHRLRR